MRQTEGRHEIGDVYSRLNEQVQEPSPASSDPGTSDVARAIAEWTSRSAMRNSMMLAIARRVPTSHDRRLFEQLSQHLANDMQFSSSTSALYDHPAYRLIVRMGYVAVPLILQELKREPNHWFRALKDITGADPVRVAHRGRMREMANDWLQWGRANGFA
jgi:hypothetical protein